MLINTFSMQHNIITTLESHSAINFTIEKLNFSKLLINLIFFGYTTGKQGGISLSTNQRFCLHFCPKPIRMRKTLHHMKFVNKRMG
jgi:hypothetical protein